MAGLKKPALELGDLSNAQASQRWMSGGTNTGIGHTIAAGLNTHDVADRDPSGFMPTPFVAKLPKLAEFPSRRIYRDPPVTTVASYTIDDIKCALDSHTIGNFVQSAQLADKMTGDDRVASCLGSRVNGLLGLPFSITPKDKYLDDRAAKKIAGKTLRRWERMAPKSELAQMLEYGIMMGFALAEVIWSTVKGMWIPTIRVWPPQLVYYRYDIRKFVVITMDGPQEITPGDGKWILYTPHGQYRGWMRGAVRAIAQPWAYRNFMIRDWARHSEKHGKPLVVVDVPVAWDESDKNRMLTALSLMGDETTIEVPQADPNNKFDVRMLEAQHPAADVFEKGVMRMDTLISCALLGQNLTTEVQGGSYAAATVHGRIRQDFLEADAATLSECLRQQLLRPFCIYNFEKGQRYVPLLNWDVTPPDDKKQIADTLNSVATAVKSFSEARFPLDANKLGTKLGIPMLDAKDGESSSAAIPENAALPAA